MYRLGRPWARALLPTCLAGILYGCGLSVSVRQGTIVHPEIAQVLDTPIDGRALVLVTAPATGGIGYANGFAFGGGRLVLAPYHAAVEYSRRGSHRSLCDMWVFSRFYGDIFEPSAVHLSRKWDVAVLEMPWTEHAALALANREEIRHVHEATLMGATWHVDRTNWRWIREPHQVSALDARTFGAPMLMWFGDMGAAGPGMSGAPIVIPCSGHVAAFLTGLVDGMSSRGQAVACTVNRVTDVVQAAGLENLASPPGAPPDAALPDADEAFQAALRSERHITEGATREALLETKHFH